MPCYTTPPRNVGPSFRTACCPTQNRLITEEIRSGQLLPRQILHIYMEKVKVVM